MYIGVDLGTTNIKAALYDGDMRLMGRKSQPAAYRRDGSRVEFDAVGYRDGVFSLLRELLRENGVTQVCQIAFTGQAESLVVLDGNGNPLGNAISWMDERSVRECAELSEKFSPQVCHRVTGQLSVLPTWPATKILWLKNHMPEVFEKAACYMLLKDYIVRCFTGKTVADMSIATFSFYFDIHRKCYWGEMLDAIGITEDQLPPLCEPCSVIGPLTDEAMGRLGLVDVEADVAASDVAAADVVKADIVADNVVKADIVAADAAAADVAASDIGTASASRAVVNIGTLDHFAGMIGTGNISSGGVTLSTGTVMALAVLWDPSLPLPSGVALHYGFMPDRFVLLPVAESGGVSLEWFRQRFMPDRTLAEIDTVAAKREDAGILFLPYIVGVNAPEMDGDAVGAFWGLRREHDAYDMARAVMEGVAFVLRKNCEAIERAGIALNSITATGGGAKSALWCTLQADATGLPVRVPAEKEAACLGAAIIAAVGDGRFADLSAACAHCVTFQKEYEPHGSDAVGTRYRRFCALYDAALEIGRMGADANAPRLANPQTRTQTQTQT